MIFDGIRSEIMIREALFKVGGMMLAMFGVLMIVVGFLITDKFMEATGLTAIAMGIILLYYVWMREDSRPREDDQFFPMQVTGPKVGK
jgi:membrane protein implicated in regulation of membrane protease activity